ncbi:MAG: DUF4157 domain-containing protein [Bacteroidota bacterium]
MHANKSVQNSDTTPHTSTQIQSAEPSSHESAMTSQQISAGGQSLPSGLQSGLESLSGYDLGDVRVHYNSSRPEGLNAWAYAQGPDIHLGPGQERHLPHEAWHVVQQMQGRVEPTILKKSMDGAVGINDSPALEREADTMGDKALQSDDSQVSAPKSLKKVHLPAQSPVQRLIMRHDLEQLDPPSKGLFGTGKIIGKGRYETILSEIGRYQHKLTLFSSSGATAAGDRGVQACDTLLVHLRKIRKMAKEKEPERPYLKYLIIDTIEEIKAVKNVRRGAQNKSMVGVSLRNIVDRVRESNPNGLTTMEIYPRRPAAFIDESDYTNRNRKRRIGGGMKFALGASSGANQAGGSADTTLGDDGLDNFSTALSGGDTRRAYITDSNYITQTPTEVTAVSSSVGGAANVLSLVNHFGKLMNYGQYTNLELAEVVTGGAADVAGIAEDASRLAYFSNYQSKRNNVTGNKEISQGVLEAQFAAGFGGAKGFILAIKNIITALKIGTKDVNIEEKDYSENSKFATVIASINAVLSGSKGTISGISQVWVMTQKGVPTALFKAIPGLDIAFAGMNLIMRIVYMAQTYERLHTMRKFQQAQMEERRTNFNKYIPQPLFKMMVDDQAYRYRVDSSDIALRRKLINQDIVSYDKKKKKGKYLIRIDETSRQLEKDVANLERQSNDEPLDYEDMREIAAENELIYINEKRIRRNLAVALEEIVSISGSLLVLTGAATAVGAGLNAGSAAMKGARQLNTGITTEFRDRAARKHAKGKLDYTDFDITKSTTVKKARYRAIANDMTDLMRTIIANPNNSESAMLRFDTYLHAMGLSADALAKIPIKDFTMDLWREIVVRAMGQRELV